MHHIKTVFVLITFYIDRIFGSSCSYSTVFGDIKYKYCKDGCCVDTVDPCCSSLFYNYDNQNYYYDHYYYTEQSESEDYDIWGVTLGCLGGISLLVLIFWCCGCKSRRRQSMSYNRNSPISYISGTTTGSAIDTNAQVSTGYSRTRSSNSSDSADLPPPSYDVVMNDPSFTVIDGPSATSAQSQ